ncbi:saccharopine dehydrogenase NADP-binding domain-containing protein [Rhodococcus sp. NPDC058521]|uniref:saccharopine dehydrogenase NADP-binding domain-containing protein n=1 Tax=Rhodococcus sp. NPDC058521 TaxID=3346536 RepID=UPI0036630AFE
MTRVLLLGATGAVGRSCLKTLVADRSVSVTAAGRDTGRLRTACEAAPGVQTAVADVQDVERIGELAAGVDVVVNCAGPSYRYSRSVAESSFAAGAAYVDAGVDEALLQDLRASAPQVPALVQAGIQPGLSGLALRIAADELGGTPQRLTAWCGGLQPLTGAAIAEYLASLTGNEAGGVSTVLRDGARERIHPTDCVQRLAPPRQFFSASATSHAHLDSETASVAAHLAVPNVEWLNVSDGSRTALAVQRMQAGEANTDDVLAASQLDLFGKDPYFTLVAEAERDCAQATFVLTAEDSYAVTGAVAAWAASIVTTMPAGVHPLWEIARPARLLTDLPPLVAGLTIRVDNGDSEDAVEEGAL